MIRACAGGRHHPLREVGTIRTCARGGRPSRRMGGPAAPSLPGCAAPRRRASRSVPQRPAADCRAPSVDRRRPRARDDGRLGPGRSAAPGEQRLSLLPSGPDEVHASPLRGTRSSTSTTTGALANADLGREFSPAGADCRYRAPLAPRLARLRDDTAPAGVRCAVTGPLRGSRPRRCRAVRQARVRPRRAPGRTAHAPRHHRGDGGEGGI